MDHPVLQGLPCIDGMLPAPIHTAALLEERNKFGTAVSVERALIINIIMLVY